MILTASLFNSGIFKGGIFNGGLFQRSSAWSPTALFSSGEHGLIYDPSDFSTMFQDAAGKTPVTAATQSVRITLDKSKGLILGSEAVSDGTFSGVLTGWSPTGGATISIDNGALKIVGNGVTNFPAAAKTITCVTGRSYKVTFRARIDTGAGSITFYLKDPTNNPANCAVSTTSWENCSFIFIARQNSVAINITGSVGAATTNAIYIDDISIKEILGNHLIAASDAARPVLKQDGNGKYYHDFDLVDDALANSNFPSLGSNATVAMALPITGASILQGQTVGPGYTINTDNYGVVLLDRPLTAQELTALTAYLNDKAGVTS